MKNIFSILFAIILLCFSYNDVQNKNIDYTIHHLEIKEHNNLKEYKKFIEDLGFKESSGRYYVTNKTGKYIGKYQFGPLALKDVNIDRETFSKSKRIQEIALFKLLKKNKKYLEYEIEFFVGKKVGGIHITKVGLLAAAHLVGQGNVKRFLYSNGNIIPKDGNDVPITNYLQHFSKYNFDLTKKVADYVKNTIEDNTRHYKQENNRTQT